MASSSDSLRATLDRLALPNETPEDRDYLVSMLRRLGYTEREIELELGIRMDGSESRTIELEYSEEPAPVSAPEPVVETPPAPVATAKRVETVTVEERVESTATATDVVPEPEPLPEPEPAPEPEVVEPDELLDFAPRRRDPPSWQRIESRETTTTHAARQDAWAMGDAAAGSQFAYKVDYRLFYRDVKLPTGRVQRIYFFSRSTPKVGVPCGLPEGYEVCENSRTGLPFLARIEEAEARRVEAAEAALSTPRRRGIFGRRTKTPMLASEPAPEATNDDAAAASWGDGEADDWDTDDPVASDEEEEPLPATQAALESGGQWEVVPDDADDWDSVEAQVLPADKPNQGTDATPTGDDDWGAWDDVATDDAASGHSAGPVSTATSVSGAFRHGDFTLYKREVPWSGGGTRVIHFFDARTPKEGEPCDLPDGYEVRVNDRTGMPYLVRAKNDADRVRVKVIRADSPEAAEEKARQDGLAVRGTVPIDLDPDDRPGEAGAP